jgi:hypothetical protein
MHVKLTSPEKTKINLGAPVRGSIKYPTPHDYSCGNAFAAPDIFSG